MQSFPRNNSPADDDEDVGGHTGARHSPAPDDDRDDDLDDARGDDRGDATGPSTRQVGLRERKKLATARSLHETAVAMVAERGLDDVTVEAICDAVGVSTRTFFNYYPSKGDALTASMPTPPDDDDLAVFEAGGPTGGLVVDLGEMVATHMATHTTSVDNLAAHHRMLHREPQLVGKWRGAIHAIEQRFTRAIATREDRPADDTGVVVLGAMTAAGIRTAMGRWVDGGGDQTVDVHLRQVFALLDASLDTDVLLGRDGPPRDPAPRPATPTPAPTSPTNGHDDA